MLQMGFDDDVELILGKFEDANKVHTLLFNATLPDWVKHIASKFLKPNKKTIDLVGNEKMKASTNVRHFVLPCSSTARAQVIPDIIHCYSRLVACSAKLLFNHDYDIFYNLLLNCLVQNQLLLCPGSVEAAQLFSLRQRNLLLNLLMCYLEHELCMGTYNSPSVR